MRRKTRYLGMTGVQMGILAVLAIMSCALVCVGGILIIANAGPAAPSIVSALQQTPRPEPSHTLPPTLPPTPPPTAGPTSTPIPGWERFQGGGAELWAPESYEGGDPSQDREAIVQSIRALGADFDDVAQEVEQSLAEPQYVIFAFDSNVGAALSLTTVQVAKELLDSDVVVDLDDYLDAIVEHLPVDHRLVDRRIEALDYYEAGRLVVEYRIAGEQISLYRKRAIYAIRTGEAMWVIQYLTERDDFSQQLPVFELSVRTFMVHPE